MKVSEEECPNLQGEFALQKEVVDSFQSFVAKQASVRAKDAYFGHIFPCQYFFMSKETRKSFLL